MKKYVVRVAVYGENVTEVLASDREEAKELAIKDFYENADAMAEYVAEILEDNEEEEK